MAKLRIPGLDVRTSKPVLNRLDHSKYYISVEVRITSWSKLLWYVATTQYHVRWWQWPAVFFIIARARLGELWPVHTSRNT